MVACIQAAQHYTHFLFFRIFSFSRASYLDYPRVHFYGKFRADASTPNNERCYFDANIDAYKNDTDHIYNWNYIGTNEFSIQDTFVTGVTTDSGVTKDEVIGAAVLDSSSRPFAKMVDIDTEWQGAATVIYGMVFRIVWSDGTEALSGKWTASSISQSMWKRRKCYQGNGSFTSGTLSTTTISDIKWGELRRSAVLEKLKKLSTKGNNKLQLSVSLSAYTSGNPKDFAETAFTLGLITGTIGVSSDTEPLNYGGERLLSKTEIKHLPDTSIIPPTDSCYNFDGKEYWMNDAPFAVNGDLLSIDLSNSLPSDPNGSLRYINPLYAGILHEESNCIELLGDEIHYCGDDHSSPYCNNDWLKLNGGIVDIKLTDDQKKMLLSSSSLAVALMQDKSSDSNETYPNCDALLSSRHKLKLMLKETNYYMRPKEMYSFLIHPSVSTSVSVPFLVSQFGKPVPNLDVKVVRGTQVLPPDGVIPSGGKWNVKTDENGIATFIFTAVEEMSPIRKYDKSDLPCTDYNSNVSELPIDGQVYEFLFCPSDGEKDQKCADFSLNSLVIRAFSNPSYNSDETYTWVDHVQPIFTQYHHLYPVMHNILNMSDYDSVTSPHNIGLLKLSMNLDIDEAGYMPVTRDLPEPQRKMILKWLENPVKQLEDMHLRFDHSTKEVLPELKCNEPNHIAAVRVSDKYFVPPICRATAISFNIQDYCEKFVDDYYFETLKIPNLKRKNKNCPENKRPLYKYKKNSSDPTIQEKCNDQNLRDQLQIGLRLELATIPLYITSLYSIGDGCNPQVYKTIRSILMQEMLHMALVGNIINAMNKGHPLIDSPDVAPKYPSIGLPGCVHPSLNVYLGKTSKEHIYNVPLVLEKPKLSCVIDEHPEVSENTIGEFYTEIEHCIQKLEEKGEEVFQPNNLQISWPWTPSKELGTLFVVENDTTALDAIREIKEQGEGASPVKPDVDLSKGGQLGHYYQLMEIVCGKKLVKVDDKHYAYRGDEIPFDSKGVWPMRDNPSKEGTSGNCYTEARAFHTTYRKLLRELQATFSGEPERITSALTIMESLLVHGKRVMRVPLSPDSQETCGPVWDYDWDLTGIED